MASNFTALLGGVAAFCIMATQVSGDTLISDCNDANLRAAVAAGGVITFACDGVIELTNTIVVAANTEVDGTGRNVTISGGGMHRLFAMTNVTFKLKNVALVDGHSKGEDAYEVQLNPFFSELFSATPGIGAAVKAEGGTLLLEGCRVEGNQATGGNGLWYLGYPGAPAQGGAIKIDGGALTISGCEFISNRALSGGSPSPEIDAGSGEAFGGAIAALNTSVQVSNTLFQNNICQTAKPAFSSPASPARGGALFLQGGNAVVTGSVFEGNASIETGAVRRPGAIGAGGAIYSESELEVMECTFRVNHARGGRGRNDGADGIGGAIASYGDLNLEDSLFALNHVSGGNGHSNPLVGGDPYLPGGAARGGAVAAFGATSISNCAFSENQASEPVYKSADSGPALGGAIYLDSSDAELRYLTISEGRLVRVTYSTASTEGAGIYATPASSATMQGVLVNGNFILSRLPDMGRLVFDGTIVSNNIAGYIQDLGHNLSSDDSGLTHATSLKNVDPVLGSLGNYGGPTQTLPLLAGSPAIDAGGTADIPAEDQRGRSRPFGVAADIGAYESSTPYFVSGSIVGASGETLIVGSTSLNTETDEGGDYILTGFQARTDTITPESDDYVFEPEARTVQVDGDVAGVNFRAYRIGAGTWDFETGGNWSIAFVAGSAGEYQFQSSSDLQSWGTLGTETLAERELHRVEITPSEDAMFFRAKMVE